LVDAFKRIFGRAGHDPLTPYLKGAPLPTLKGERVILRHFELADVERRVGWPKYESPFFSHINLDLESEGAKRRWYELRLASRYPFWFAIDTFDTKLIGELALRELDRRKRSTRLGIHLSPSYIGQGLGSDALGALLEFYFGELGFRHMHLDVARYNQRAIRCYQKCGFVKVSEFLRGNLTGVRVLKDKNLEEFWDCFVEKNGREYAIFWEMVADSPNVNVSGR